MKDITSQEHQSAALTIRQLLAAHSENEDLLSIGAYRKGSNRVLDVAVEMRETLDTLLRQTIGTSLPFEKSVEKFIAVASQCQAKLNAPLTQVVHPAAATLAAPVALTADKS